MSAEPPKIDPDAARDLAPHLGTDERLLWAARPDAARYCRVDRRLVVLGLFWCVVAGAAFYGFTVNFLSEEFGGLSWGLRVTLLNLAASPFVAVALYALGGHVVLRRRRCRRIAFAISTTRVLALAPRAAGVGPPGLRALPRDGLAPPTVELSDPPVGDVEFHDPRGVADPIRFECVPDAAAVAALAAQRATGT